MKEFKFDNIARRERRLNETKSWYQWKVFMDEDDETLDSVASVDYLLHPTFPDPLKTIDNPTAKFCLSGSGWGMFAIQISIALKSGETAHQKYVLNLDKPWEPDRLQRGRASS